MGGDSCRKLLPDLLCIREKLETASFATGRWGKSSLVAPHDGSLGGRVLSLGAGQHRGQAALHCGGCPGLGGVLAATAMHPTLLPRQPKVSPTLPNALYLAKHPRWGSTAVRSRITATLIPWRMPAPVCWAEQTKMQNGSSTVCAPKTGKRLEGNIPGCLG